MEGRDCRREQGGSGGEREGWGRSLLLLILLVRLVALLLLLLLRLLLLLLLLISVLNPLLLCSGSTLRSRLTPPHSKTIRWPA